MCLLVLGIDTSALQEDMGSQESTLHTWLTRSRAQSRKLHERFFQAQNLGHIQLDELWANVKQAQQAVWVWTVCEVKTKIIPVIQLGTHTQDMAYSVIGVGHCDQEDCGESERGAKSSLMESKIPATVLAAGIFSF